MTTYLFDQAWRQEHDRLRALEALFDDASTYHLDRLGVSPGWRCLEVGAGAGGVARSLAGRVGPTGQVLATDLDPRFLDSHGRDNLKVARHDILADPLPDACFDLAHARAVLDCGSAVLCGAAASGATGTLAHCAQPPLCEGASAAASAKANKAELSAVPRQVSEGRKSTARPAATWEASRRTTDMTVLATFTSLDYPAII